MKLFASLACVSIFCHSVTAWYCITKEGTFTKYGLCRYSREDSSRDLYCTSQWQCTATGNRCTPLDRPGDMATCV
ncbi:hypothetical protein ACJQWK_05463 [Exserohilum turcicum]